MFLSQEEKEEPTCELSLNDSEAYHQVPGASLLG